MLSEADVSELVKIVVARNPYDRLVSFYSEKLQTNPLWKLRNGRNDFQDSQRLVLSCLGIDGTNDPQAHLRKLNSIPFAWFLELLPEIAHRDGHLHPQTHILAQHGFDVDVILKWPILAFTTTPTC